MINISKNTDERSDIYQISFVYTSLAIIRDYPGPEIFIHTFEWKKLNYSSATFQESDEINGEPVSQELNIKLNGSNEENSQTIRDVCGRQILVRLDYSNGEEIIIGTEDNPVALSHTSSGSPIVQTLFFKRNSAEKAKHLKSF